MDESTVDQGGDYDLVVTTDGRGAFILHVLDHERQGVVPTWRQRVIRVC